jgi:hypothetical protein
VCPEACSGHGICSFIEAVTDGTTFGTTFNEHSVNRGHANNGTGALYHSWEWQKIRGCKCDRGYSGPDCSSRLCPKGDDPMTYGGDNEVQYVSAAFAAGGQFYLTYHDQYGGTWNTRPHVPALWSGMSSSSDAQAAEAAKFKTLLTDLPNFVIEDLTVTVASNANGVQYRVTFDNDHTSGDQKLLECHNEANNVAGAQPRSTGLTDVDGSTPSSCVVTEHLKGSKEAAPCSNRGICASSDGICECFEGYTDEHCAVQSALV